MRSLPIASALFIASALAGSTASADDRAIAQQAFQEGRDLMAAGKVAEACPKFAAAAQLSPTAGVRLNLATCYAKLGKTASAWSRADEALTLAERAGDSAAATLARDQLAALKPNLSYVTLAVAKETSAPAMEVALDGEKIPGAVWGTPFPVDPGEHAISATAPGYKPWSTKTTVAGTGTRSIVSVPVLVAQETGAPSTGAPTPARAALGGSTVEPAPGEPAPGGPRSLGTVRALAVVSGGLGVVGLGIGAGFGLDASAKKSSYEQHPLGGKCVDELCVTISKDAVTAATVSTIGFVAGGVLAACGLALWLTAPGKDRSGRTLAVLPMTGPQGTGAGVSGSL